MSRIGKQSIEIPAKTEVTVKDGLVTIKGAQGTISRSFKSSIIIEVKDNHINLVPKKSDLETNALWGTYASHIFNMVEGANKLFTKKLIVEGIGYKADVQTTNLVLTIGFSHPIILAIPEGLKVTVEKGVITISGVDKEVVGQFAAEIRSYKKPEPYKGKGIRYEKEVVRRKQGKKSV